MKLGEMKKTITLETFSIKCKECEEDIESCDECDEYFDTDETIYCHDEMYHYCWKCAKKLRKETKQEQRIK